MTVERRLRMGTWNFPEASHRRGTPDGLGGLIYKLQLYELQSYNTNS